MVRTARLRILGAALLFSTGGAAIKACSVGAWQVAGFRSGIAAVALAVLLPASRRRWTRRTWLVSLAYAATLITFVAANKLTTAAAAIYLQSVAPLYLLLLAPWLLREPVRRADIFFIVALGAGLALLLGDARPASVTAPAPRLGAVVGAFSGVTWALTLVGLRGLGRGAHGDELTAGAVVAGNIVAFVACLPLALPVGPSRPLDWILLAYLGVVQIGFAYVFLTSGVRHVPALEASLLLLLEPALNPLWAFLVHGERPGAWSIGGGAIVMASTAARAIVLRR
jgi:drug/metabolite transporter (DMT)-like permease